MDFEVIFVAHVSLVLAQTTTQMLVLGCVKMSREAYLGLSEQ